MLALNFKILLIANQQAPCAHRTENVPARYVQSSSVRFISGLQIFSCSMCTWRLLWDHHVLTICAAKTVSVSHLSVLLPA